jgi:hypothetical protein
MAQPRPLYVILIVLQLRGVVMKFREWCYCKRICIPVYFVIVLCVIGIITTRVLPLSKHRCSRNINKASRYCVSMDVINSRVKLTTHLHLVPTLRIRGAILLLPDTPSWRRPYLNRGNVFMAWYLFKLRDYFQTGSGTHQASYPMSTRGSFPGGKAAGAWNWPLTSI